MAYDLTPTTPLSEAKTVCAGFSPGLRSLLELGDTTSAVDHLAESPGLLAEVRAGLPALTAVATLPAGRDGVQRVLSKALVLFRLDMTEPEWAVWWDSYVEDLGDLPEAALEAGMKAHRLGPDAEFMPKPGRLRELARQTVNRPAMMLERARAALARADRREEAARQAALDNQAGRDRSPVDRATVDQMLAGYRAQVADWKVREAALRPARRPTQGKTDEHGITAELRAALARREER